MCLCAQVKAWGLMRFYWANRGTCGSVCSNIRGRIFEYDFRFPQRQMDKAKSPHVYGCLHRYAACCVRACVCVWVFSSCSLVPCFLSQVLPSFHCFLFFSASYLTFSVLLSFTALSPIFFLPSSIFTYFSSFFLLFFFFSFILSFVPPLPSHFLLCSLLHHFLFYSFLILPHFLFPHFQFFLLSSVFFLPPLNLFSSLLCTILILTFLDFFSTYFSCLYLYFLFLLLVFRHFFTMFFAFLLYYFFYYVFPLNFSLPFQLMLLYLNGPCSY